MIPVEFGPDHKYAFDMSEPALRRLIREEIRAALRDLRDLHESREASPKGPPRRVRPKGKAKVR